MLIAECGFHDAVNAIFGKVGFYVTQKLYYN